MTCKISAKSSHNLFPKQDAWWDSLTLNQCSGVVWIFLIPGIVLHTYFLLCVRTLKWPRPQVWYLVKPFVSKWTKNPENVDLGRMAVFTLIQVYTNRAIAPDLFLIKPNQPSVNPPLKETEHVNCFVLAMVNSSPCSSMCKYWDDALDTYYPCIVLWNI